MSRQISSLSARAVRSQVKGSIVLIALSSLIDGRRAGASGRRRARLLAAADRLISEKPYFRREISVPRRLVPHEVRAQILFIVVGKDRHDYRFLAQSVTRDQRTEKVRSRRYSNRKPQVPCQLLCHQYRVAVRNAYDLVELFQVA